MNPATAPARPPRVAPRPRWIAPEPVDGGAVRALAEELRLPLPLATLLVRRNHGTALAAREFLRPHPGQMHSPWDLAGMADAVDRIRAAIHRGETILVHGDYDVDGICATALYTRALRRMGARVEPFVPHRLSDGYDLSEAGIRAAREAGASLILTGDCGIVAFDAVARARSLGIDVVVTDHHTPGARLPEAVAVVNPSRTDCGYAFKGLVGAGVAYKLCCAVAESLGHPVEPLSWYLDLVAVATIADVAPLTDENRALVRWGLRILPRTANAGLRALLRSSGLADRSEVSAGQVGFVLAPRINAVGRMSEAARGVRLLLTDDPLEAERIAAELEEENRWRREVDGRTLREALDLLERDYEPERDRGVVLARPGWHPGVIGIVASRVVERIHRPTVLIALGEEGGKGSARSIPGYDLYQAMRACSGHLERFGGHRAAAGCSIHPDRVAAFRAAFLEHTRASVPDSLLLPDLRIDVELPLAEADVALNRLLRHLAPFGMGNPTPVLASRRIRWVGRPRVVGTGHLKLTLSDGETRLDAIGFGMGERMPELSGPIDVAYRLEENGWAGDGSVQARLVDFLPSG